MTWCSPRMDRSGFSRSGSDFLRNRLPWFVVALFAAEDDEGRPVPRRTSLYGSKARHSGM